MLATVLLAVGASACGSAAKGPSRDTSSIRANPVRAGVSAEGENAGGSDDNIPAYGHEASAADRRAITALVERYYAAAAAGDGKTGCRLIYSSIAGAVPEDYGKPPGPAYSRGKTCPVVLAKVFGHIHGEAAGLAVTAVTGVRVYRDRGFAELRSSVTPNGEIFVEREHGSWKIGALMGKEQPPIPSGG
jgi:hypothetical protein